jgi:DNA-binding NtrC family response regulator
MIYLISKDNKTVADIKKYLGRDCPLEPFEEIEEIFSKIMDRPARLIILDLDSQKDAVLKSYKSIRQFNSSLPVIILSSKPVISEVVALTKLGAEDFLAKPVKKEQLLPAITRALEKKRKTGRLSGIEEVPWLRGGSQPLKNLLETVGDILGKPVDLVLIGEAGCDLSSLAGLINQNSAEEGVIKFISLSSFGRDVDEAYFWVTIQELLSLKERMEKETRFRTIYISGLSNVNPLFQESVLGFLNTRRRDQRFDKDIRIILESFMPIEGLEGFQPLIVPPLRFRRSDIAEIVEALIAKYAKRFDKQIKNIGLDLMPFFNYYDFPGNYFELRELIKGGVSRIKNESLTLSDLSISSRMLENAKLNELKDKSLFNLEEARREFERMVFNFVLDNVLYNNKLAAQFLDLPESVFAARVKELGLKLLD